MQVPRVDTDVISVIAQDDAARCTITVVEDSSLADWWFAALDQRRIRIGDEHRPVYVMSVHVRCVDVWIQVEVEGEPRSLILHLRPGAGVYEAVETIGAMIQGTERQHERQITGSQVGRRGPLLPITSLSA